MTNVVHRVNIIVARGFEMKDTRWDDFAMSGFKDSKEPFAFWDVVTSVQPGRNDLRQLAQARTQGIRAGERPGQLPSPEFAPFTTVDPEACDAHVFYEDRVATLRVVRPKKKGQESSREVVKTIGDETVKSQAISTTPTSPVGTDPEGLEVLMETNSFLLQGAREVFQEKYQISETFGEPVFFAFGKRQQIFQYDGMVFDTQSWQWKEKFLFNYDQYLRGTKAVESGAIAILTTNTAIIRGYVLSCSIGQSDATHGYAALSFSMFVVDRFPIEPMLRTPQQIKQDRDEDPTSAFFVVTNQTGRAGEVLRTVNGGPATVLLPSGFQAYAFDTSASGYASSPDTHLKPTEPIGGVDEVIELDMPGGPHLPVGTYNPPDLIVKPVNAKYLNNVLKLRQGRVGLSQRLELQAPAPSGVNPTGFSMAPTEPWQSPSDTSADTSLLHHAGGVAGGSRHSLTQINKMKELAQKGLLVVKIANQGPSVAYAERKVTAFRQRTDPGFESIDNRAPNLGLGGLFGPNAFEIQLDRAITPGELGVALNHSTRFKMQVFEDKTFVDRTTAIQNIYHAISPTKLRRVANSLGFSQAVVQTEKHVFRDPAGAFDAEFATAIAAGDLVYIQFPFPVVDNDEPTLTPTAKVRARAVNSATELQLGKLTFESKHGPIPVGEISFASYKITVERATELKISESRIRDSIKNPPDGVFSNQDVSVAEVQSPRGVFKLVGGEHYAV